MPNTLDIVQSVARRFASNYIKHQLGNGRLRSGPGGTDAEACGAPPAKDPVTKDRRDTGEEIFARFESDMET